MMRAIPRLQSNALSKQKGAVLAVSLILLLVMTILGVSNMKSSSLELRMASNNQSRQNAFQAAETALRIAEINLEASGHDDFSIKTCASGTSTCYEDQCEGGLCFTGTFTSNRVNCDTTNGAPTLPVWTDPALDVWNTDTRHQAATLSNPDDATADFIVEFLCFIDDGGSLFYSTGLDSEADPLYRITSLATSGDGRSQVMLQSTYRLTD